MNALTIAKKDFRDAVQSRALWGLVVLFVLLSLLLAVVYVQAPELAQAAGEGVGQTDGDTEAEVGGLIFFLSSAVSLFVAIAAIVVAYKAVAGERESGSIKLLLSLRYTRRDVLVGKVLGRGAVLATALGVGLIIGLGAGLVLLGSISIVPLVVFVLLSMVFAGVYAAIIVGLSAMTGSTNRAAALTVGFFFVFEVLWDAVALGSVFVAEGFSLPTTFPDWYSLVIQIPPGAAYFSSLTAVLPDVADAADVQAAELGVDTFYATPELGLVYLIIWAILPFAIGYSVFVRADL